jgi:outer membrane lipoprotein-sorting protein
MRRLGLVRLLAGLALCGAGALPAAAQSLPVEMVLLPPRRPGGVVARQVAPVPADGSGFTLTVPPPPQHFQAGGRAARAPAEPVTPAAPQPTFTESAKPAAQRPAATPPAPASATPSTPIVVAAATPAVPVARAEPLTDGEIVERANAFFNSLGTLVADFIQIGGDGRRLGGTLYLQRPGKVRFEYDPPSTLEVIADGSSVAVRDTKLATQDLYSISQTPLKFLLRERVNLGQDIRITDIANEGDAVRLSLEDRSTLGGTARIMLFFDARVERLTQWRITDAQGFQTTVILNKVDRTKRVDQRLFVINYDRVLNNDR